jgi:lysozyme family protein
MIDWLDEVIRLEGGYVNDKTDNGGETKYGISANAFPHEDILNLTIERAKKLYLEKYVRPCKAHQLKEDLQYIHFDTAVNMGVNGAAKVLQRAAKVEADGIIGNITIEASKSVSKELYLLHRAFRYMSIIGNNHSQAKYSKGWKNRLKEML